MENKIIMLVANDTTFIYKLRKEILDGFVKKGYRVIVVAKIINFYYELESIGCKIIDLNFERTSTNPISDIRLLKQIFKILKSEKPDIVFSNSIKPNVYFGFACNKLKIKFVPNITGLGRALEYPGILQKISILLYKIGMKGADIILFQNEFNKNFFLENKIIGDLQKFEILPGSGVNLSEYKKLQYPKSEEIVFLFIARIRKEKGIDLLINAAKELCSKYDNLIFNVCGLCEDSLYLEKFKDLEKEGYFKYFGEQKSLTSFYESSNCIIHPTFYPEGMSNVLLEAGSHARPIITTDRPGCREIVIDGYNGYMIKTQNQLQLNQAIEKFINLSNEQKRLMGENGRKNVEKNFNRESVVSKYLDITERLSQS